MHYTLINSGILFLLFNLIIFIKEFSNKGRAYRVFTYYLGVVFCIQLGSNIMMRFLINNIYLSHFYFIGQFVLLSLFYLAIFKENFQKKIVIVGMICGLSTLAVQYGMDSSLFYKFNLFEIFVTSFLLIVFATLHFYNLLNEKKEFYYINMGILLYLFGSTILFLVGNLTTTLSPQLSLLTWTVNAFLYLIYQFFIFLEWKKSFSKKAINTVL